MLSFQFLLSSGRRQSEDIVVCPKAAVELDGAYYALLEHALCCGRSLISYLEPTT